MNDLLDGLKTFVMFVLKSFISIYASCFVVIKGILQTNNDKFDFVVIVCLTILIYYLLSNIRNANMYKKLYSVILDILFHKQRKEGRQILYDYCKSNLVGNPKEFDLLNLTRKISKENKLCIYEIDKFLIDALNKLVDSNVSNNVSASKMFSNICSMISGFILPGLFDIKRKLNKYYIEETLMEGNLPIFSDNIDEFNLQKVEKPVYQICNVPLYKWKSKIYYEGTFSGHSKRISKGFWLCESQYKEKPIEYKSLEYIDTGNMLITNKHIYYSGEYEIFRIPLEKIISIDPRSNGLTIQKDGASAKPTIFKIDDTLFVYEIIKLLSKNDIS